MTHVMSGDDNYQAAVICPNSRKTIPNRMEGHFDGLSKPAVSKQNIDEEDDQTAGIQNPYGRTAVEEMLTGVK